MDQGRILAVVVLSLMLCGCIPQKSTPPEKIKQQMQIRYRAGITFLNEGKTPQAIKELLAAKRMAESPGDADVEHVLGLAFQQKGLYDKAIEQYDLALKLDPKLTEARNNLGTVYLVKSEYDNAIKQFEGCLKDPEYVTPEKARYNLGVAYFHKKDIDKAIEHYEKAVLLRGDNTDALYNLAFCFEEKKEYAKAIALYKKATGIDPTHKDALFRQGLIQEHMKDYITAAASFRRVLKIDPEHLNARLHLGIVLAKTGETAKAFQELSVVSKADPAGDLGKQAMHEIKGLRKDKFKGIPKPKTR